MSRLFSLRFLRRVAIALGSAALLSSCGGGDGGTSGEDAAAASASAGKAALAAPAVGDFAANGWYWNPAEGGIVAFFMYEESTGKPIWYAAYGDFAGGAAAGQFSFAGDLRVYRGGQAVSAGVYTSPTWTSVGPVSIAFNGNRAAVQLPGGRRIDGERYVIDGSGFNHASPVASRQNQPEVGWYWNPAEGGRGYGIEVQNNKVFMAMFHYNLDGSPTWNVAQGDITTGVNIPPFELYSGGQTLTSAYRGPTKITLSPFTLTFRNACAGQMQYSGAPAITVRRFRIDGTDRSPGAECNAVAKNVFPLTPGLRTGGAVMEPGDSVYGKLNVSGEVYSHGYNLQAGRTYTFTVEGSATGAGTLANPNVAVHDANLVTQLVTRQSPGSVKFSPASTGVYYIVVQASPAGTGSYLLASDGTANGIAAQPAPSLSNYEGSLTGTSSGRSVGTLSLVVDAAGRITGGVVQAQNPGVTMVVAGNVVAGGSVSFTATGSGTTLAFNGFVSPQGKLSGVWSDAGGPGGVFVVNAPTLNSSATGMVSSDTRSVAAISTDSGARITVPPGAVPATSAGGIGSIAFSIEKSAAQTVSSLQQGETQASDIYQFGPGGTVFAQPVQVTVPIRGTFTQDQLKMYRINPSTGVSEPYPATYDPVAKTLTAQTYQFSRWYGAGTSSNAPNTASGCVDVDNTGSSTWRNVVINQFVPTFPPVSERLVGSAAAYSPGGAGWVTRGNWYLPQGNYQMCVERNIPGSPVVHSENIPVSISEPWRYDSPRCTRMDIAGVALTLPGDCSARPPVTPSVGTGTLQISLSWNSVTPYDLDLRVKEPGGEEIYYGRTQSSSGGSYDRDNRCSSYVAGKSENIYWTTPPGGQYDIFVDLYSRCSSTSTTMPFEVRVVNNGVTTSYPGVAGATSGSAPFKSISVVSGEGAGPFSDKLSVGTGFSGTSLTGEAATFSLGTAGRVTLFYRVESAAGGFGKVNGTSTGLRFARLYINSLEQKDSTAPSVRTQHINIDSFRVSNPGTYTIRAFRVDPVNDIGVETFVGATTITVTP